MLAKERRSGVDESEDRVVMSVGDRSGEESGSKSGHKERMGFDC